MKRTKAQALQTREQLMLAALDVFYCRGVSRASLNEIAQTAGVTRGALYWHFKDKEDLFEAIFQHIFNEMSQKIDEDIRNNAPNMLESLRQALVNNSERIQYNETHRKFCHILYLKCEHTEQNESIIKLMNNYQQMWRQQTYNALQLCVRQGSLPRDLDIELAALYFKSAIFGLVDLWLRNPERFDLSRTAARIADAAIHTLKSSPALRQPS